MTTTNRPSRGGTRRTAWTATTTCTASGAVSAGMVERDGVRSRLGYCDPTRERTVPVDTDEPESGTRVRRPDVAGGTGAAGQQGIHQHRLAGQPAGFWHAHELVPDGERQDRTGVVAVRDMQVRTAQPGEPRPDDDLIARGDRVGASGPARTGRARPATAHGSSAHPGTAATDQALDLGRGWPSRCRREWSSRAHRAQHRIRVPRRWACRPTGLDEARGERVTAADAVEDVQSAAGSPGGTCHLTTPLLPSRCDWRSGPPATSPR